MTVAERHQRNTTMIQLFARLMVGEMAANAAKGDWVDMTPIELMREVTHHVDKLFGAMLELAQTPFLERSTLEYLTLRECIQEYAADTANIAMFIAVIVGDMMKDYEPSPTALTTTTLLIEAEQALTLVDMMRRHQQVPTTKPKAAEIQAASAELVDAAVAKLLPRIRERLADMVQKQHAAPPASSPLQPNNDRDMFYSGGDCVGCNDEGCSCNRAEY